MARGGFELSIKWRDEKVEEVSIKACAAGLCKIKLNESMMESYTYEKFKIRCDGNISEDIILSNIKIIDEVIEIIMEKNYLINIF